jgi:hypothetical protein
MLDSNVEADSPLSVTLGAHHLPLLPSTKVQILTPEGLQLLTPEELSVTLGAHHLLPAVEIGLLKTPAA